MKIPHLNCFKYYYTCKTYMFLPICQLSCNLFLTGISGRTELNKHVCPVLEYTASSFIFILKQLEWFHG